MKAIALIYHKHRSKLMILLGIYLISISIVLTSSCTSLSNDERSQSISRKLTELTGAKKRSSNSGQENDTPGKIIQGNDTETTKSIEIDVSSDDLSCDLKSASKGAIRKVTNFELTNALGSAFAINLLSYANQLPPEIASSGFKNAIITDATSDVYTKKLNDIAPDMATKIMSSAKYKTLSIPSNCESKEACGAKYIEELGLLILGKPLSETRAKNYQSLMARIFHAAQGGMEIAQKSVLSAMIQAPENVYRVEENSKTRPLNDYEIASRLAFFLWQSRPDQILLNEAKKGSLKDPAVLEAQIDRMLENPMAKKSLRVFVSEWFSLAGLSNIQRDPKKFPRFNSALVSSMREEVFLTWEDLAFGSKGSMMSLLKQEHMFIDSNLAGLYGIKNFQGEGFKKVAVDEDENRFGVLTMAGILSSLSASDDTNPVSRGIFFQNKLLCTEIPPPPPDAGEFDDEGKFDKDATYREKFEEHRRNPSCAGCHNKIDPLGLSLEQYNSLSVYRDKYTTGRIIDASGAFQTSNGEQDFENVSQLSRILSSHVSVSRCMVRKVFQFATGVESITDSRCQINHIHDQFKKSDYSFNSLVKAVVLSPSFSNIVIPN